MLPWQTRRRAAQWKAARRRALWVCLAVVYFESARTSTPLVLYVLAFYVVFRILWAIHGLNPRGQAARRQAMRDKCALNLSSGDW